MTAALEQPRDAAGRFASHLRPSPLLVDVPPIPVPVPVDEPDERPNVHRVPAPRCPHGSFARWAAHNCCAPKESRRAR